MQRVKTKVLLIMVDHSDHVSMKNAAKCDNLREMQKPVNVEFSNSNGLHSYSMRMFFWLLDSYQTYLVAMALCCDIVIYSVAGRILWTSWVDFQASSSTYQRQIEQGYGLNLSILISPGKENNCDSPSNGEWSGKRPSTNELGCDQCLNVSYASCYL